MLMSRGGGGRTRGWAVPLMLRGHVAKVGLDLFDLRGPDRVYCDRPPRRRYRVRRMVGREHDGFGGHLRPGQQPEEQKHDCWTAALDRQAMPRYFA